MRHVLIGTDSRGRKLEQYILKYRPFPEHWKITLAVVPGATLSTIKDAIMEKLTKPEWGGHFESSTDLSVVIAAGICNLTEKQKHTEGVELCYLGENKVDKCISEISTIQKEFMDTCQLKPKFVTIAPVSLAKYQAFSQEHHQLNQSRFTHEELQSQQKHLEQDIREINETICFINSCNNFRTVRWDRDLLKHTTKKRGRTACNRKKMTKFTYRDLYDGCHAVDDLAETWYRILCNSVVEDFYLGNPSGNTVEVPSDSDTEDEEKESWDFKRRYHGCDMPQHQ